jgi:preprotein translocase subunit SecY
VRFHAGDDQIIRAGSAITTPGVNAEILREWFRNVANAQAAGVSPRFSTCSAARAGALRDFSLGIMPYISASIMLRCYRRGAAAGQSLREDAAGGRSCDTRHSTIALCVFQGYLLSNLREPSGQSISPGHRGYNQSFGIDLVSTHCFSS